MSNTSKSVSVPTTTTCFFSVCAQVSAIDMSVRAICWSPAPRSTLGNCCHIQASVRCVDPISPTQCSTTDVNRLFWLMAMAGLRQPKQLNNNAAPLNPYLLTLCLSAT